MALRSAMDSVFQLQDALLTVGEPTPYRLYRLVLVWRSSYKFELSNYIADSRRRAKFKFCLVQLKSKQSITSQLIPTEQLLFLLWCKSSKTVIISSGNFLPVLSANNIMMNMTTLRVLILTEILSQQLLYLRWIDVG